MRIKDQTKTEIVVELLPADKKAADWLKGELPRKIELSGYTADAFLKLNAAGHYGVHRSQIDLDALPRLEQAGIAYKCYNSTRRGTGNAACWVKLDLPHWLTARIIESEAA